MAPARFVGVDGPRWFLRAMYTGSAAVDPDAAAPLEAALRDVVVVRGSDPMAVRDPLPLRLPPQAQEGRPRPRPSRTGRTSRTRTSRTRSRCPSAARRSPRPVGLSTRRLTAAPDAPTLDRVSTSTRPAASSAQRRADFRQAGPLRRALRRIRDEDDLEAQDLQVESEQAGATAVVRCSLGGEVCIAGTLRVGHAAPAGRGPTLEAELYDGTGSVALVFLGRRRIRGVEPGRALVARGRLTKRDGLPDALQPVVRAPARRCLTAPGTARAAGRGPPRSSRRWAAARGLVDSALPATVFVLVRLVDPRARRRDRLRAGRPASSLLGLRLRRGESLQQVGSGFFGLVLAVLVARATGTGKGFFLPGILTTAAHRRRLRGLAGRAPARGRPGARGVRRQVRRLGARTPACAGPARSRPPSGRSPSSCGPAWRTASTGCPATATGCCSSSSTRSSGRSSCGAALLTVAAGAPVRLRRRPAAARARPRLTRAGAVRSGQAGRPRPVRAGGRRAARPARPRPRWSRPAAARRRPRARPRAWAR